MPRCCNCGCDIPADDKIRLCDKCKKIILPFIKFVDASTSPALRRLVSNEKNLRNAGVTDGGMEYLLRICELHDRQKQKEREEREAAKRPVTPAPASSEDTTDVYSEVDLPIDKPLHLYRKPYGRLAPLIGIILMLLGAVSLLYEIVWGGKSVSVILCSIGLILVGYVIFDCRHLLTDTAEIKKWFR